MSDSLTPITSPIALDWPPILEKLQAIAATHAEPIYLVGGAVRDAFLRRNVHDLDFATAEDGRIFARLVANKLNGAYYALDADRGVGRAIIEYEGEKFSIDVSRFRGTSLADDLLGRDFTMNAMAVALNTPNSNLQQIIDPLHGLRDMSQKKLRRCSPDSISSDPVRVLRAIRQSVALNMTVESETRKDLHSYGPLIASASVERVRDEFMNIISGPRPHAALRVLDVLGLLRLIIPEVEAMHGVTQSPPHVFDVWEHTLNVVERLDSVLTMISPQRTSDNAADSANGMIVYMLDRFRRQLQTHLAAELANGRSVRGLLVLAALLHDAAKPATRSVGQDERVHFYQHEAVGADLAYERAVALRLSNEETKRLSDIVRHHMRPMTLRMNTPGQEEISRRTVHRFWKGTGESGVDVCILTMADYLGMVGMTLVLQDWIHHLQIIGALLEGYFNQKAEVVSPPPLLSGHELMEQLTLDPGPEIGRLLGLLIEAQAVGEITTPDEALALARKLLNTPTQNQSNGA
jgi:tRNA nucleotidyltransferase/poly(A) polymerase